MSDPSRDGEQGRRIQGLTMERPFGKLAPGMGEIGAAFKDMWKDLERNSEKFGCTFALPSFQPTRHRSTMF